MQFKRISLSVTDAVDERLDELDRELRRRKGVPPGGGWRSKIVAMLVASASPDALVSLVEAEEQRAA